MLQQNTIKYFLFLNLAVLLQMNEIKANSCDLGYMGQVQAIFMECFIKIYHNNTYQFSMCNNCSPQYQAVKAAYKTLQENCSKVFEEDSVQVVATLYGGFTSLWNKAYCDDCFKDNKTAKIVTLVDNFNKCTKNTNESICVNCLLAYEDLNSYYERIDLQNKGKVCYDLHFMVNKTRVIWSKQCQRQANLFIFFIPASIILCLTIAFYSINIWLTRRHEQNHEILFNIDAQIRNRQLFEEVAANGTTVNSQPNENAIMEKILAIDNDSLYDSDEQILLNTNKDVD